MLAKHEGLKKELVKGGVTSPRTLFPEINDFRNTLSLGAANDGPARVQMRLYCPESVADVTETAKALFNSYSSIDQCLESVEKLRRDLQRARN